MFWHLDISLNRLNGAYLKESAAWLVKKTQNSDPYIVASRCRNYYFFVFLFTQCHRLFYCSRTLPNTFAFIVCGLALSYWLRDNHLSSMALLTISAVCFRCETAVMLVMVILGYVFYKGGVETWRAESHCRWHESAAAVSTVHSRTRAWSVARTRT